MNRFLPAVTATKTQTAAYLFGIALFSISFLVFLNASISFVVTDIIGQKHEVGDAVGTLGFADELVALVACPLWGLVSDRIGVRNVAVMGYCIIALSFILLVQSHNVFPQLLLGRLLFSLGGAACTTMVTAILPTLTMRRAPSASGSLAPNQNGSSSSDRDLNAYRHSGTFSVSSELTITPARYSSDSGSQNSTRRQDKSTTTSDEAAASSQLAGYVGMFTGIGALLAVALFLPLPAAIGGYGMSKKDAVKGSFYIVACIAFLIALLVFFGLRGLAGDEGKGFRNIYSPVATSDQKQDGAPNGPVTNTYLHLVKESITLAFKDSRIALGYLGGFVARASSVAISLFIPLFVNAYFIRKGLCTEDPGEDIKSKCRRAYTLASMLTGFAELAALICAPIFGWFNSRMSGRGSLANLPLSIGALAGIVGSIGFGIVENPEPFSDDGSKGIILAVILLGISQISAIVCSLGSLAKGIRGVAEPLSSSSSRSAAVVDAEASGDAGQTPEEHAAGESSETDPLIATASSSLSSVQQPTSESTDRIQLKGTIAGIYSLLGGGAILLLTKLGGVLFDKVGPGAPFFLLAGFNGMLLVGVGAITVGQKLGRTRQT